MKRLVYLAKATDCGNICLINRHWGETICFVNATKAIEKDVNAQFPVWQKPHSAQKHSASHTKAQPFAWYF